MRTLLLLRHAKSSWDDHSLADRERPLNARGLAAAPFIGERLSSLKPRPDVIVSSPAVRARETASLIRAAGLREVPLVLNEKIYEASPNTLREVALSFPEDASCVLVVGHNPGLEGFIHYLTGVLEPMPTAALASMQLNIENWSDIDHLCGKILFVLRPRDEMRRLGLE